MLMSSTEDTSKYGFTNLEGTLKRHWNLIDKRHWEPLAPISKKNRLQYEAGEIDPPPSCAQI